MYRKLHVGLGLLGLLIATTVLSFGSAPASADQPAATQPAGKEQPPAESKPAPDERAGAAKDAGDMAPIEFKLPKPAFKGTPTNVPPGTRLEAPRKGPRPPVLAPKGAANLAAGLPVAASDEDPIVGKLSMVTNGDKEASEGAYVELGPGVQYVQLDLKQPCAIYAILIWHYHVNPRVYHDVVVQAADDKDFITNVRTLFNNDHDNSAGLGIGKDQEYWDTFEGKLIDAQGLKARFLRFYSNGSTADDQNHYTEIEVYGSPVK